MGDTTIASVNAKTAVFLIDYCWLNVHKGDPKLSRDELISFATSKDDFHTRAVRQCTMGGLAKDEEGLIRIIREHHIALDQEAFRVVKALHHQGQIPDVFSASSWELMQAILKVKETSSENAAVQMICKVKNLMSSIGRDGDNVGFGATINVMVLLGGGGTEYTIKEIKTGNPVDSKAFKQRLKNTIRARPLNVPNVSTTERKKRDGSGKLSINKHCPPLPLRFSVIKAVGLWRKVSDGLYDSESSTVTQQTAAGYVNAAGNLLALSLSVSCGGKRYADTAKLRMGDVWFPYHDKKVPLYSILAGPNATKELKEYLGEGVGGPLMFRLPLAKDAPGKVYKEVVLARFPRWGSGVEALEPVACALACLCVDLKFAKVLGYTFSPDMFFVRPQDTRGTGEDRAKRFTQMVNQANLVFADYKPLKDVMQAVQAKTYGARYNFMAECAALKMDEKAVAYMAGHSSLVSREYYLDNGCKLKIVSSREG